MANPTVFDTAQAFRRWLEAHHATGTVVDGLWRGCSGTPAMARPKRMEQALRFGWIDGCALGGRPG